MAASSRERRDVPSSPGHRPNGIPVDSWGFGIRRGGDGDGGKAHEGPLLNEGLVSGDALVDSLVDTASQALVKLAPMPLD